LVHRFHPFFETLRGDNRSKLPIAIYDYSYAAGDRDSTDAGDKCGRLILYPADANGARLAGQTSIADVDVSIARGKVETRFKSQGDVIATGCVSQKRVKTYCCILVAGRVVQERTSPVRRVVAARVEIKHTITGCRVVAAGFAEIERTSADGGIVGP